MTEWHRETMHGLPCRVLLPEPYDPRRRHPLVIWLHGSGERGDDNEAQLRNGVTALENSGAIIVAPQAPKHDTFGGSWYGGESETQRAVVAMTRELAGRASVDARRVYLVGFSMGAIGAFDIVVRHPDLFAAAVMMAGDLDVDAFVTTVPIWAIHGERDELVSNKNVRALDARGGIRYTELAGAGHDVWRQSFAHAPLWQWLFGQTRIS
jgi:predicted peptidase